MNKDKCFKLVLMISSAFLLFFSACNLEAAQSQLTSESKEQVLISHVKMSIENAEKDISQLNEEILSLEGLSSSMVRHFLNNICSLKGANYLEIGCWKGSTLVSAAYKNEENLSAVVGIDNWSQFDGPKDDFLRNVNSYIKAIPLRFYEADCFSIDKSQIFQSPVNIYFYDGNHSFEDQKSAFTFYNSVFDDVFIAIVDDWNWEQVRNGTFAAFQDLGYKILYEQPFFTARNLDTSSWWNGFYIAVIKK